LNDTDAAEAHQLENAIDLLLKKNHRGQTNPFVNLEKIFPSTEAVRVAVEARYVQAGWRKAAFQRAERGVVGRSDNTFALYR
jgi:hypothetical protein